MIRQMGNEYHFWGNVDYDSNEEAKAARDKMARDLKAQGIKAHRSMLANQTRKYSGLGQPDGRTGHVYILHVVKEGV